MNQQDSAITINKENEMRSMEIANMINEGGLGAEEYYVILKHRLEEEKRNEKTN